MPTSRSERLLRFGSLAASIGLGAAEELLKRRVGAASSLEAAPPAWLSKGNAERIVATLSRMRGAALKLGQMVSMQDEAILSPEIEAIFARVRDGAHYMPEAQLEAVMCEELGPRWREHFDTFDMVPFSAASIGQVHRATVRRPAGGGGGGGGESDPVVKVAVKVQYPGVAKSIISDLENLKALLVFASALPKGLFLDNTVRVASRELAWECDYRREAAFMEDMRGRLESSPHLQGDASHGLPRLYVPAVHKHLSTGRVLVTDFAEGVPLAALIGSGDGALCDGLSTQIMKLCLLEIFSFATMQTDPNWSNFLYDSPTNRLALIDFGAARTFSPAFTRDYLEMMRAAGRGDRAAIVAVSRRMAFLTGEEAESLVEAHVQAVLALGLPFAVPAQEGGLYDFGRASDEITGRVRSLIPTMLRERLTPPPEESYSLHRKLSGAFLLCVRLGGRVPCAQLLADIARE